MVIVGIDFPSSIQLGQTARMRITVQNQGDQDGYLTVWIKNNEGNIAYFSVEDATVTGYRWTLNVGVEVSTQDIWPYYGGVMVPKGGTAYVDFNFYNFGKAGSYSITVSTGHDTTKDDSRTVGCPEGEEAQREAERYASM
jgi:hypothetical protein